MTRLTRSWLQSGPPLPADLSCGPLTAFPERVIQFGTGNFLRAFAGWMVDEMNARGLFAGSIVAVQATPHGKSDLLNAQDGLYTLHLRGVQQGHVVDQRRIVTAVSRALDPYRAWDEVCECFRNPALRFVFSNTTEAGIADAPEPYRPDQCPVSFPAKVALVLHERFRTLRGEPQSGLIFLPCELIDRNGSTLRELVRQHAQRWSLGLDFNDWIDRHHHFLNTLVDRIVPGYPKADAPRLTQELSYEDPLYDVAEPFHRWIIEGPPALAEEFPAHRAGLNVVWTDNLIPHRARKVRLLNGAHTTAALAGFLAGLDTVRELVEEPVLGSFIHQAVFAEILPFVPGAETEGADYATTMFDRFRNPFIRHELLSIALNSVAKWRVRVLPCLLDYCAAHDRLPPRLTFSLAALLAFYCGERTSPTELTGRRGPLPYPIRDEAPVLDLFAELWSTCGQPGRTRDLAAAALGQTRLWGIDLNTVRGLTDRVAIDLLTIAQEGMRGAVEKLLASTA
jgi:tagaturonate reductase